MTLITFKGVSFKITDSDDNSFEHSSGLNIFNNIKSSLPFLIVCR